LKSTKQRLTHGIRRFKRVKEALIKWDSQGPKALEPPEGGFEGSGRSPEGVNQYFLKSTHFALLCCYIERHEQTVGQVTSKTGDITA
jgi:hypothetical protein